MGAYPNAAKVGTSGQRVPLRDLANAFQRGTATLSGGTISISAGITVTANSTVQVTRNTPGGTLGNLSVPVASHVVGGPGTGTIVINSDDGGETSTVDYLIVG